MVNKFLISDNLEKSYLIINMFIMLLLTLIDRLINTN